MKRISAILSMLHEPAGTDSASRRFRGEPVLGWTLRRLARSRRIEATNILCWDDQLPGLHAPAADAGASVHAQGVRRPIAAIDAVTAAQKFADGWRGGLFGTCAFDRGFHGPGIRELARATNADAVVLVDPSAGLVDADLIDALADHALAHADTEMVFSQAAPGLSGVLLTTSLLHKLADAGAHPGRILSYMPSQPVHDPIAGPACAPVPTPVARTTHRFTLDSDRQIRRLEAATIDLNGQLTHTAAERLVAQMDNAPSPPAPRELVLELTVRRATQAIFRAGTHAPQARPDLTMEVADRLLHQLARWDDIRLHLIGSGDPLLHPGAIDLIARARDLGIHGIHVQTDLVDVPPERIAALAESGADVVSVHLPAVTEATYRAVMGTPALRQVLENIAAFVQRRRALGRGTPLLVPTFVKCAVNLAEMETWYDQWLAALGSAVITGPDADDGPAARVGVGDMTPPTRRGCVRLPTEMMVLSDGRFTTCARDVGGVQSVGAIGQMTAEEAWRRLAAIRADHDAEKWGQHALCANCKGWYRA